MRAKRMKFKYINNLFLSLGLSQYLERKNNIEASVNTINILYNYRSILSYPSCSNESIPRLPPLFRIYSMDGYSTTIGSAISSVREYWSKAVVRLRHEGSILLKIHHMTETMSDGISTIDSLPRRIEVAQSLTQLFYKSLMEQERKS